MHFVFATSLWKRLRGLLGTSPEWGHSGRVLVLYPCRSVHTFGMHYEIDIAFARKDGIIMRADRAVGAMRLLACKDAAFVLERPHSDLAPWLRPGERLPFSSC